MSTSNDANPSVPNASHVKLAITDPTVTACFMSSQVVAPVAAARAARYPTNPPANVSPAPGGVDHLVERVGWRKEDLALVEHERPVLSLLDHNGFGPHGVNGLGGLRQEVFACQLTRLFVVDCEHVHPADDFLQVVKGHVHPKVHGVKHHELGGVDLVQHLELHLGVQVAQHHEVRLSARGTHGRLPTNQHIQIGGQGVAPHHVVVVAARPMEAFAPLHLGQSVQACTAFAQLVEEGFGEVLSNDADHMLFVCEVAHRQGNVAGGAPHHFA